MSAAPPPVTCTCGSNIAVIKYWGKRDEQLILPINSSLSVTLDAAVMGSTTTVAASPSFPSDKLWLNGEEESLDGPRTTNCLAQIRDVSLGGLHAVSRNNFPTAAGLASSASGLAALVFTAAQYFGFNERYPGHLTALARMGSGSACRSLYGGFVKWEMGVREDGSDSIAVQVAPETHWPELVALVCVVNANKKAVSSTSGMMNSVKTSPLLAHRAAAVVPDRLKRMEAAIMQRDFQTFADITMMDSNQFHATCLDTFPPIFYMNDVSRVVVAAVHALNKASGRNLCAYTFDAGPNAVLFCQRPDLPALARFIVTLFPPADGVSFDTYCNTPELLKDAGVASHAAAADAAAAAGGALHGIPVQQKGCMSALLVSGVGAGATVVRDVCLIDPATGAPPV